MTQRDQQVAEALRRILPLRIHVGLDDSVEVALRMDAGGELARTTVGDLRAVLAILETPPERESAGCRCDACEALRTEGKPTPCDRLAQEYAERENAGDRRPIAGHCIDIDRQTWHRDGERCQHCGFGVTQENAGECACRKALEAIQERARKALGMPPSDADTGALALIEQLTRAALSRPCSTIPVEEVMEAAALADFAEYYRRHPDQRFWQALQNWSGHRAVLVTERLDLTSLPPDIHDTFYQRLKQREENSRGE